MKENESYESKEKDNTDYQNADIEKLNECRESGEAKLFTFIPYFNITVPEILLICKFTGQVYCVDHNDELIATIFVYDGIIQDYDILFSMDYQKFGTPGFFVDKFVEYVKPDSPTGKSKSLQIKIKRRGNL